MNARKFLLLFFLCAAVPLAAAKMSLTLGWFSNTGTNKGQWLQRDIQLLPDLSLLPVKKNFWRLVYVQAARCDQSCEQALYVLQQLYTGLGVKQKKVKTLVLASQVPAIVEKFPAIAWFADTRANSELHNQIVIVNQQGLALLAYPLENYADLSVLAKNIRSDLLKLTNYDRSGS